mmetsp:Transcript_116944/g.203559  ORF Transcript_116944/g.203559 Transcript_116944/m.203559 type:complete len:138 (-) Transcript_116944:1359-1772(-)
MGKRRARAKPVAKKKYTLATTYNCPFCDHDGSVDVKMNHAKGHARLQCGLCGVNYQMSITSLDDPVDVYHAWLDKAANIQNDHPPDGSTGHHATSHLGSDDEEVLGADIDDDDGFIVHDNQADQDAFAEYAPPTADD